MGMLKLYTLSFFIVHIAGPYLLSYCLQWGHNASQRHLCSASRHHLSVPRYQLTTFGRSAFSVAGLAVWNSLLDSLQDLAISSSSSFRQHLTMEFFNRMTLRYIDIRLTFDIMVGCWLVGRQWSRARSEGDQFDSIHRRRDWQHRLQRRGWRRSGGRSGQ